MLAAIQQGVIDHYREALIEGVGEGDETLLRPGAIKPYGGEMHQPNRLAKQCPVTFVEFDNGAFESHDAAGDTLTGSETVHVICCALNQSGGTATANDGVRLLSWALTALSGLEVHFGRGRLATWENVGVERLLSGERLWAAALTPQLTVT